MSIKEVSEYSLQTTYACGHVWKSNLVPLDHTQEERERMIRAIERWSESDCWSCQQSEEMHTEGSTIAEK